MFLLVIHIVLLPTPHLCFDTQKLYWAYAAYYTGHSFEQIFMKFTWSVRVHLRLNPIVFGNNRTNRTTHKGKNVPPKQVFWFSFIPYGVFCGKKFLTVFLNSKKFKKKMI